MNSAKLQNKKSTHKNQLYFYALAMNNPKRKLRGNSICNNIKNTRNKLKQGERLVHWKLQNVSERN